MMDIFFIELLLMSLDKIAMMLEKSYFDYFIGISTFLSAISTAIMVLYTRKTLNNIKKQDEIKNKPGVIISNIHINTQKQWDIPNYNIVDYSTIIRRQEHVSEFKIVNFGNGNGKYISIKYIFDECFLDYFIEKRKTTEEKVSCDNNHTILISDDKHNTKQEIIIDHILSITKISSNEEVKFKNMIPEWYLLSLFSYLYNGREIEKFYNLKVIIACMDIFDNVQKSYYILKIDDSTSGKYNLQNSNEITLIPITCDNNFVPIP